MSHIATESASEYDTTVVSYLQKIFVQNLNFYYVQDTLVRGFCRNDVHIFRETIPCVIFEHKTLVEKWFVDNHQAREEVLCMTMVVLRHAICRCYCVVYGDCVSNEST